VSIGDALAQERREAGLTIAQVSHRTCIREAIIRGIERDDFSACGGDFYARGHIRNIARAVGADPGPLIAEYDAEQGEAQPVSAAEIFKPAAPVRIRERSRLNWTLALAVAVLAAVSFGAYLTVGHYLSRPSAAASQQHAAVDRKTVAGHHRPEPLHPASWPRARHRVSIQLTATGSCWVELTTVSGRVIFNGTVLPGQAEHWVVHRSVHLALGNPGGVVLRVNGHRKARGGNGAPVTLALGPGHRAG
jgi:transcriptional regulator with XRE-family HTH domain